MIKQNNVFTYRYYVHLYTLQLLRAEVSINVYVAYKSTDFLTINILWARGWGGRKRNKPLSLLAVTADGITIQDSAAVCSAGIVTELIQIFCGIQLTEMLLMGVILLLMMRTVITLT